MKELTNLYIDPKIAEFLKKMQEWKDITDKTTQIGYLIKVRDLLPEYYNDGQFCGGYSTARYKVDKEVIEICRDRVGLLESVRVKKEGCLE